MTDALLEVRDLDVSFGSLTAVDGLSFELRRGETLGVVGESGCGKSLSALAIMRLTPTAATLRGSVQFDGQELLTASETDLEDLRGQRIAMVFQEPMTALNPVVTVGEQVAEMFILHQQAGVREAHERATEALAHVHIADPVRRARDYPHQLSGGMRQRAMIAMALACGPDLLIADEPTTALDVTVQAQILDLFLEMQEELGMGMVFISHNLGVVSQVSDRVLVMYAGKVVETAPARELFERPRHPYTRALMETLPKIGARAASLPTIPGNVPSLDSRQSGCGFADRCALAAPECRSAPPSLRDVGNDHLVACLKTES